jgi:uncharacterized protein YjcR
LRTRESTDRYRGEEGKRSQFHESSLEISLERMMERPRDEESWMSKSQKYRLLLHTEGDMGSLKKKKGRKLVH